MRYVGEIEDDTSGRSVVLEIVGVVVAEGKYLAGRAGQVGVGAARPGS